MNKRKTIAALLAVWAAAGFGLTLVEDGKPLAEIVIPADANSVEQVAAVELTEHVKLVSGVTLPTRKGTATGTAVPIRLGRAAKIDLTGLTVCQGRICVTAEAVDIAGVDGAGGALQRTTPAGTLFGVYEFIERELGVRWLWPGDLGRWAPRTKTVTVREQERTVRPMAFSEWRTSSNPAVWARRENAVKFDREQNQWLRRHRFGVVGGLTKGHAFTDYSARFHGSHPEFFNVLPDGRRESDPFYCYGNKTMISMCVTEPEFVRQVVADWVASGMTNDILNANENDTAGKCCCARCLAADRTGDDEGRLARARAKFAAKDPKWYRALGSVTDRYVAFYKAVLDEGLKVTPGCRIIAGIYANYSEPPSDGTTLGDRVVLRYCPPIMYPWTVKKLDDFKRIWSGWSKTGAQLMMRPNFLLDGYNFPLVYYRWFAQCFDYAHAHGLAAQDYDSLTGMYGANGLTLYVVAGKNGNPSASVEELENDYFAAFGRAADRIRAYIRHFEEVTERGATTDFGPTYTMEGGHWEIFFTIAHKMFTKDVMLKGFALLDEADAAEDDPVVRQRVDFLRTGLKDACLVSKTQRAFERYQATSDPAEFSSVCRQLMTFRARHEHLGYANRGTMEYLEGRIWPLHYGLVGAAAKEIVPWEVKIDAAKVGLEANWQADTAADGWRPVVLNRHLLDEQGRRVNDIAWYRASFDVKAARPGKATLTFGALDGDPTVWLNGVKVLTEHPVRGRANWRSTFAVDVTGKVKPGANRIVVRIDKKVDGPRGLHRPVFIEVEEVK